jgi:hypothetical protein
MQLLLPQRLVFAAAVVVAAAVKTLRLDSVLAEAVSTTYYFLDWRDFQPVSAVLLKQHDLLPEEVELDDVSVCVCGGGRAGGGVSCNSLDR